MKKLSNLTFFNINIYYTKVRKFLEITSKVFLGENRNLILFSLFCKGGPSYEILCFFADFGSYFSIQESVGRPTATGFANFNTNIGKSYISKLPENQNLLIPVKRAIITFSGREQAFRDQTQWNDYVNSIVSEGGSFLDHQFSIQIPEITNSFHKNYHNSTYEDFTKNYDSNLLLNYNLISYPFKDMDDVVKRLET